MAVTTTTTTTVTATAAARAPGKGASGKKEKAAGEEKAMKAAVRQASVKALSDMANRKAVLDEIYEGKLAELKDAMKKVSHRRLVEDARKRFGMRMQNNAEANRKENCTRVCEAYIALTDAPGTEEGLMKLKADELTGICRRASLRGYSRAAKAVMAQKILAAQREMERFVGGAPEAPEESVESVLSEESDDSGSDSDGEATGGR